MNDPLESLLVLIEQHHGIGDKERLAQLIVDTLGLTRDRSVYYCKEYAIRFCSSSTRGFGNAVLSLSVLQKYDDRPFVVCVVTPQQNHSLIANSTFLKKISHSSQALRVNNIRGSFNGSDIVREFEGIQNTAENIQRLFEIHAEIGFEGNLPRLVEATNNISPLGAKFVVDELARATILEAPFRAARFVTSHHAETLRQELDAKVAQYRNEILLAALIENTNVRGRVIEYLLAGNDAALRQRLAEALQTRGRDLPAFKTGNALGDYRRQFDAFDTATDVKTKIRILNSNPKGYNLDKMLEFLAHDDSVFMFYFVGIEPGRIVNTVLVSMFQQDLLEATILLRHWAGRNSRGVSQFEGRTINRLLEKPNAQINQGTAVEFLNEVIAL